jgi:hypothetical protein
VIHIFILCSVHIYFSFATPVSSPNWELVESSDGVRFSGRNGKENAILDVNNMRNMCNLMTHCDESC